MDEQIEQYLTVLQVESGCAINTVAAYRRDLNKLQTFLRKEGIEDARGLTKPLWLRFLSGLKTAGLSSASLARCLASARGFYKWMSQHLGYSEAEGFFKGVP